MYNTVKPQYNKTPRNHIFFRYIQNFSVLCRASVLVIFQTLRAQRPSCAGHRPWPPLVHASPYYIPWSMSPKAQDGLLMLHHLLFAAISNLLFYTAHCNFSLQDDTLAIILSLEPCSEETTRYWTSLLLMAEKGSTHNLSQNTSWVIICLHSHQGMKLRATWATFFFSFLFHNEVPNKISFVIAGEEIHCLLWECGGSCQLFA